MTSECLAWLQNVGLGQRLVRRPSLSEEITAQERFCRLFKEEAADPSVGQVRRRKPAHGMRTEGYNFIILHGARSAVSHVTDRDNCSDLAAERHGIRRNRQEIIESPAFICLVVRERDIAQTFDRQHRVDRVTD